MCKAPVYHINHKQKQPYYTHYEQNISVTQTRMHGKSYICVWIFIVFPVKLCLPAEYAYILQYFGSIYMNFEIFLRVELPMHLKLMRLCI